LRSKLEAHLIRENHRVVDDVFRVTEWITVVLVAGNLSEVLLVTKFQIVVMFLRVVKCIKIAYLGELD
jgi:hypothetical protein